MFINQGRNRGLLFIVRTLVSIPDPTGVMLTGVKLTGVKINIPYSEYNFEDNNYNSNQVNLILQTIDSETVTELTWRVIHIDGNKAITDQYSYESLIAKGFEIYGDTLFGEAGAVISKMTNPSPEFRFAITEYVEAEEAAKNNNWLLTAALFWLQADTDENARVCWNREYTLQDNPTISPIFWPYYGFQFLDATLDEFAQVFTASALSPYPNEEVFAGGVATMSSFSNNYIMYGTAGRTIIRLRAGVFPLGSTEARINYAASYSGYSASTKHQRQASYIIARSDNMWSGASKVLVDERLPGGGHVPTYNQAIDGFKVGRSARGLIQQQIWGQSDGFDFPYHQWNAKRYSARMHEVYYKDAVDTVLAKFTGLIDVEIEAVRRFVAEMNGGANWPRIGPYYLTELLLPANQIIDITDVPANGSGLINPSYNEVTARFDNTMIVYKATSIDWNIENNTYDYSITNMDSRQLYNLTKLILDNSDNTTTGRTLNISGNRSLDFYGQDNVVDLIANGWIIIQ